MSIEDLSFTNIFSFLLLISKIIGIPLALAITLQNCSPKNLLHL